MNQYIFLITFLFVTNTKIRCLCHCNLIQNQFSCMLSQRCQWKSNSCQKKSCEELYFILNCQQNKDCFYNFINQRCQELTDCSMLNATSDDECRKQSIYCGIYNSELKQCQSLNIKDCNMYTTQSECSYTGQNQLCYWINQQCQYFDCALIKSQNDCVNNIFLCSWASDNQQCIPITCNQKPISDCSYIIVQQNTNFFTQPCLVDYSEGQAKCRNATLSELSPITCSLNTYNAATWSDKRLDRGSCQQCDIYIIKILVLTLLMMIL